MDIISVLCSSLILCQYCTYPSSSKRSIVVSSSSAVTGSTTGSGIFTLFSLLSSDLTGSSSILKSLSLGVVGSSIALKLILI